MPRVHPRESWNLLQICNMRHTTSKYKSRELRLHITSCATLKCRVHCDDAGFCFRKTNVSSEYCILLPPSQKTPYHYDLIWHLLYKLLQSGGFQTFRHMLCLNASDRITSTTQVTSFCILEWQILTRNLNGAYDKLEDSSRGTSQRHYAAKELSNYFLFSLNKTNSLLDFHKKERCNR